MARALGRISLVVFLTLAVSYQSWSIIVPPDNTDFLFTAIPAAKLIPSLFDIDDEHRGAGRVRGFDLDEFFENLAGELAVGVGREVLLAVEKERQKGEEQTRH